MGLKGYINLNELTSDRELRFGFCEEPDVHGRDKEKLFQRRGEVTMVKNPTMEELTQISHTLQLGLSSDDITAFRPFIQSFIDSYNQLDRMVEPKPIVKYPRTPGFRPSPTENSLGAWYWKSEIVGADQGVLKGKRLAVKDNIAVAGVPLMNGTNILEGYIPDIDATVVERILDAGGTILGKAVCENLCFSGGSHTSDVGPVRNPYDPRRSAGGSSSGSAVLVATGEVDMALGGDQGGSIRIPGSWCGIYGLKPTHGLVPYTGAFPIEPTLDHLGPMAANTYDVALLLDVIAGPDGLDPRQTQNTVTLSSYREQLVGTIKGLRIGVVQEGFGWPSASESDVDDAVREMAYVFERLGVSVSEVSIPLHREAMAIWNAIGVEGTIGVMLQGNGMGVGWKGYYATSLMESFGKGWRNAAYRLPNTVKQMLLVGQYMQERYFGRYYAKAQNLARVLRNAYDAALERFDILVMPTLPMKATPLPDEAAPLEEYLTRAFEMVANTAPFDVTGHPAMTIPCALSEGLPVGMMLIGKHYGEGTVLRLADAFEKNIFRISAPPIA